MSWNCRKVPHAVCEYTLGGRVGGVRAVGGGMSAWSLSTDAVDDAAAAACLFVTLF